MILYEDNDLSVLYSGHASRDCFVTFTSWGKSHVRGFGQQVFDRRQTSGVYFISRWDHWWRTDGMPKAIEAALSQIRLCNHDRIISYGASMGGYGAALYAKHFGAAICILIAPQFEIRPELPPFEKRWAAEASKIVFVGQHISNAMHENTKLYIIYDPYTYDRKHVDLFAGVAKINRIHVAFGGHVPSQLLAQAGMLKDLVFDIASGAFSETDFFKRLHANRRRSAVYWANLGEHAGDGRMEVALCAIREACRLAPKDVVYTLRLVYALLRRGAAGEALLAARKATELAPNHPAPWRALAKCLQGVGSLPQAVAAAQQAVKNRPKDADLHRVLLEALIDSKRFIEAIETAETAIALDPKYARTYDLLEAATSALRKASL